LSNLNARSIHGWEPLAVAGNPKITMTVATYEQYDELACLLYSFKAQTWTNWEAVLIHDGPGPEVRKFVRAIGDPRIRFFDTQHRQQSYGHHWRNLALKEAAGDFIGQTNGDNYYCPVFFEWMLHTLTAGGADLAYCDLIHSHRKWEYMRCGAGLGLIDLGCYVGARDLMRGTPWTEFGFLGDGIHFEAVAKKAKKIVRIDKPLFVHN